MNSLSRLIILLVIIFSIVSCSADAGQNEIELEILKPQYKITIDLDNIQSSTHPYLDSSTQWMDVAINKSSRIDIHENYLFILNSLNEGLEFKVYDTKLKKQIFLIMDMNVNDFSVDHTKKELFLLIDNETIRKITFEGKLISTFRLSEEVIEIRKLSPDKIVGYDNYRENGEASFYIFDIESGTELTRYLPFGRQARGLGWSVNTSMTRNTDVVYSAPFLSNDIYKLSDGSIAKWIELDFGKYNGNFEEFVDRKDEAPFNVAMQNKWVYSIDSIIENDNAIACVIIKDGKAFQFIFNKKDPTNWSISNDVMFEASSGSAFVHILRDKDSVTIKNGEVMTNRFKLQFYKY